MLVGPVAHGSDDDIRRTVLFSLEFADPGTGHHVFDHFLGNQAGIGIIPIAAQVDGLVGLDTGNGLAAAATGEHQGKRQGKHEDG